MMKNTTPETDPVEGESIHEGGNVPVPSPGELTEDDVANDEALWGGHNPGAENAELPDEEGDAGVGDVDLSD